MNKPEIKETGDSVLIRIFRTKAQLVPDKFQIVPDSTEEFQIVPETKLAISMERECSRNKLELHTNSVVRNFRITHFVNKVYKECFV